MGQHEYAVGMSSVAPEDIPAVAFAFRAGEQKAIERIKQIVMDEQQLVAKLVLDPNFINKLIDEEY